jgi:small-conductance mechanosensitive channel
MPALSFRLLSTTVLAFWLLLGCPAAGLSQEPPRTTEKIGAPATAPEVLPRILAEGAEALEKEAAALKSRAALASKTRSQAEKDSQERKAAVAAIKASLAVTGLPLAQAEEALKNYSQLTERLDKRLKELAQETEALKKEQAAREASQTALQAEVARLQATRHPVARSKEMRDAQQRYQRAAAAAKGAAGQLLGNLEKESQTLEQDRRLISELRDELQSHVDTAWKAELLKRQERLSLTEQAAKMWQAVRSLPAVSLDRCAELWSSGVITAFLRERLAALIGLLALAGLLAWGLGRLGAAVNPLLARWLTKAHTRGEQTILSFGQVVGSHLFLLGLICWVGLSLWSLGLWEVPASRVFFYLLAALGIQRLGGHWLWFLCRGEEAGGLLPLDAATASFYRRYLRWLLAYLVFGAWGLAGAGILGVPPGSRQFLGHLFRIGLLGWAMWLLRWQYLEKLLPELPGPHWIKQPATIRTLRSLIWLLLAAIVLTDLLGFQNLANYLAQAGALTGVILLLLILFWLGMEGILHYLLHPEKGWARRRYPQREETLRRLHRLIRGGITVVVGSAALLLAMQAWGLEASKLAWLFQWVNWGPTLGSVKLTPLTIAAAALALYLGGYLSRLARSLMELRVFPRTGWDSGVCYTISTTLHYTALLVGGLVALNILGFPLTNLALIAGALGVGIGFGLQNIVNNFISGLILLFERPIKVGDILVIDGQWGTVKEIRVRSTIFETYDRYVLIIPNSELLSGKIANWTHYGGGINRLELKVGVAYGADVRRVAQLATEICLAHPRVLKDPPPEAFFKAFGDSSLDFVIWVFLQSPKGRIAVTHELNTAILEAFQREGIEIPFPQRDLYIKNWPETWTKGKD